MKRLLIIALLLIISSTLFGQNKTIGSYKLLINRNIGEGERKALLIGNQKYDHVRNLQRIYNDVDSMEVALSYLGFKCKRPVKDGTRAEIEDEIKSFIKSLSKDDVACIYYSGHGLGYNNTNWLLPKDFDAKCVEQIESRAINFEALSRDIQKKGVRNYFLFVDACRDQAIVNDDCPTKSAMNNTNFVQDYLNPNGYVQVFATEFGKTASFSGSQGSNSIFTESLLKFIRQPIELKKILDATFKRTFNESRRLNELNSDIPIQEPIIIQKLYDDFYFLKRSGYDPGADRIFEETTYKEVEQLLTKKDYVNALSKLNNLVQIRYLPAQSKLAYIHLNGLGVKQNIFEASKLYSDADRNGNDTDTRQFLNTSQKFNKQLLAEKKAFNQNKFIKVGGIAVGAGALFLGGTAMYNSVQREAESFNENMKLWDANNDGFLDNIDFEDGYNAAANSYNQKRKLFPFSNILKIVGGGAAAAGIPIVVSKKFKGIDYNFGVGHDGQPLIFKLTKPL